MMFDPANIFDRRQGLLVLGIKKLAQRFCAHRKRGDTPFTNLLRAGLTYSTAVLLAVMGMPWLHAMPGGKGGDDQEQKGTEEAITFCATCAPSSIAPFSESLGHPGSEDTVLTVTLTHHVLRKTIPVDTPHGPQKQGIATLEYAGSTLPVKSPGDYVQAIGDPLEKVPCCARRIVVGLGDHAWAHTKQGECMHTADKKDFAYGPAALLHAQGVTSFQGTYFANNIPPILWDRDQLHALHLGAFNTDLFDRKPKDAMPYWPSMQVLKNVAMRGHDITPFLRKDGSPMMPNVKEVFIYKTGLPWEDIPPVWQAFPQAEVVNLFGAIQHVSSMWPIDAMQQGSKSAVDQKGTSAGQCLRTLSLSMPMDGRLVLQTLPNLQQLVVKIAKPCVVGADIEPGQAAPIFEVPDLMQQRLSLQGMQGLQQITIQIESGVSLAWKKTGAWQTFESVWQAYASGEKTFPGINVSRACQGLSLILEATTEKGLADCVVCLGKGILGSTWV